MVKLALSMRGMTSEHGEIRDALANDWGRFLKSVSPNFIWFPVPNIGNDVVRFLEEFSIDGIVLTGGEDWGVYKKRDETEECLFKWAIDRKPIIGICRGAQIINKFFGGELVKISSNDHVGVRHKINMNGNEIEVNSFHNFGILMNTLGKGCKVLAIANDNSVEAFSYKDNCVGIMWHPERETEPAKHDIKILKNLFNDE